MGDRVVLRQIIDALADDAEPDRAADQAQGDLFACDEHV